MSGDTEVLLKNYIESQQQALILGNQLIQILASKKQSSNDLLDVSEAAEILGISKTCIYKMIKQGQIETRKFGKRYKIPSEVIDELGIDGF